jgi:two-component system NtrC family sensor kinase
MNTSSLTTEKGNILVVDDMPENLLLLSNLLNDRGYKVRSVINGKTALKAALAKVPDIILLDINMPDMNGYEVCESLKASEVTREVPIIFISAYNDVFDKVRAFEVGGVDYVTKPFNIEEVLARVETQLKLCQTQKLLREQNQLLEQKNLQLEQEIQERKTAQTALELSEAQNHALLNAIPDLIFRINREGYFLDYREAIHPSRTQIRPSSFIGSPTQFEETSKSFSATFPSSPESLAGQLIYDVFSNDLAVWTMHYVHQTLLTKEIQIGEYVQQVEKIWHHYEARYVMSGENEVIVIVREISDRKQADAVRLQSEALWRMQSTRLEQALRDLQEAQTQLVQNEKMVALGQLVAGIAHELNNPVSFIYGNLTYANQYLQELVALLQVYQQEFPHPTPKIQQVSEALDLDFLMSDLQKLMESMHNGADRIRQIVISLRNFSRLDEAQMKSVDIHEGIDSTLLVLQHRLRATESRPQIEVIKKYSQLPNITCYASQLNQVFLNLLNNAIDALDTLRWDSSAHREITQSQPAPPPPIKFSLVAPNLDHLSQNRMESCEGDFLMPAQMPQILISTQMINPNLIQIQISDNGPGIPQSVQSRLFDPFFTTKPVGSGRGLGLSISYQIIVDQHKGKLTCHSSQGQGAEFLIQIPCTP